MNTTKSITRSSTTKAKRGSTRRPALPALNLRTILVPVDFSKHSLAALDFAVNLAQLTSAPILVCHALDPIYSGGRFDSPRLRPFRAEALAGAKQRLAKLANQRVKPHATLAHRVVEGVAYTAIVNLASQVKAGLIVMGSQGRTGLSRLFIGSVAERVVRLAPCPVLVVRK